MEQCSKLFLNPLHITPYLTLSLPSEIFSLRSQHKSCVLGKPFLTCGCSGALLPLLLLPNAFLYCVITSLPRIYTIWKEALPFVLLNAQHQVRSLAQSWCLVNDEWMNERLCCPQQINFIELHFRCLLNENENVYGSMSNNESSYVDFCVDISGNPYNSSVMPSLYKLGNECLARAGKSCLSHILCKRQMQ